MLDGDAQQKSESRSRLFFVSWPEMPMLSKQAGHVFLQSSIH